MEKMAWDGPKWGREGLFPADPDLADILGDTDSDFEISNDGGLMLAENERDLEKLNMKIELEKSAGVKTDLIKKDEILKLNNSISEKMIYAGYCKEEGKINPLKATTQIYDYCLKKGLKTYCDDLIFDIKKENNKFLIKTKNREIEADIVVNCAGSWANNIANFLNLPLNVKSVPQQMIVTEATKYELKFPPCSHILVFYIPVINIVNLIDYYLNYCNI